MHRSLQNLGVQQQRLGTLEQFDRTARSSHTLFHDLQSGLTTMTPVYTSASQWNQEKSDLSSAPAGYGILQQVL